MTKKTILLVLALAVFFGSFFLTWFDYRVQRDLTGLDFIAQYRWLIMGLAILALMLTLIGQYSVISGLFVLLFLAQLFYASARNMNRLAPGFYLSLAMTVVTGFILMTLKDHRQRNVIHRGRRDVLRSASGRKGSQTDGDSPD